MRAQYIWEFVTGFSGYRIVPPWGMPHYGAPKRKLHQIFQTSRYGTQILRIAGPYLAFAAHSTPVRGPSLVLVSHIDMDLALFSFQLQSSKQRVAPLRPMLGQPYAGPRADVPDQPVL